MSHTPAKYQCGGGLGEWLMVCIYVRMSSVKISESEKRSGLPRNKIENHNFYYDVILSKLYVRMDCKTQECLE